jgi:ADP-dependent NAD(P)H-hydrate dehydratase / NAD(P)H-hydrate epimerase
MTLEPAPLDADALLFENTPQLWKSLLPHYPDDVHKYQRGHCLVISGPELKTGASRLAATAALNNGAGAVTIAGTKDALRIHATHVTAIMLEDAATAADCAALLLTKRFDAVIIGPAAGVGERTLAFIHVARNAGLPAVLDADALTSLVGHMPDYLQSASNLPLWVMTPHQGEFAKLFLPLLCNDPGFNALPHLRQSARVEQARAAARIARSVIVYKGFETVIAAPDGRAAINTNAGPELATAGSGDVLSGLIGAHLAAHMPAFEAAAAAVWLHGYLGAKIGTGLTADRLVAQIKPLAAFV